MKKVLLISILFVGCTQPYTNQRVQTHVSNYTPPVGCEDDGESVNCKIRKVKKHLDGLDLRILDAYQIFGGCCTIEY